MALTTDRISVLRGRPPMRAGGRRGFRTAHCWLVRSLGYGFGFIPFLRSRPPFGTDSQNAWLAVVPVWQMPARRKPKSVQPWDRPCFNGGPRKNRAIMTQDGLMF